MIKLKLPSIRHRKPLSGVYFLFLNGNLQYVGKAKHILSRIGSHRDKDYNSFAYIECTQEEAQVIEIAYIKQHKPPLNTLIYHGINRNIIIQAQSILDGLVYRHQSRDSGENQAGNCG